MATKRNMLRYEKHNVHLTSASAEKRADRSERNEAVTELEKYMRAHGVSEDEIQANLSWYMSKNHIRRRK